MTVTVNGVHVEIADWPSAEMAAIHELLRQRAVEIGLATAAHDGGADMDSAIEQLLAREVTIPDPTDNECRRYYEAHRAEFQSGDIAYARHILFQVTAGAPVAAIRARAEQALHDVLTDPEQFEALAKELSNCPSGQHGGNLGQISRGDTVPEFERAIFRLDAAGVLPSLIKTRYGFHIVAVDRSIPGKQLPFEAVQTQIADRLRANVDERALRQYVSILAGRATIEGVNLDAAGSPLVQ
jgi:peptidyl-prolyl cis-trans isomerase C